MTAEKIVDIKDCEEKRDSTNVAGFEVVTTNQSIKLFIDNDSSCCENWGYFWCNDDIRGFVGAEFLSISITDSALDEVRMNASGLDPTGKFFEGNVMFVNLETSKGTLQFIAYNEHNGYYGHIARVECTQLTYVVML